MAELIIGIGKPAKGDKEAKSDDMGGEESPSVLAAKALIKAVKSGDAQAVSDAFGELLAEHDEMAGDKEPAEDMESEKEPE